MVSWKQRADIDDRLVTGAVSALLTFLKRTPEPTLDQAGTVMETLSDLFGRATAATAFQALRTSRELHDLWEVLPEPRVAGPAEAERVLASTAWALQTRSGKELTAEQVKARLAGTLTRLVREPGRTTVFDAVRDAGTRWARIPGPYACDFCLMLASRGAVYESRESASTTSGTRGTRPEGLRYHDRCTCHIVESYSDHDLPAVTKMLNREWYEVTWDENGPVADQRGVWNEHIAKTRPEHTTLPSPVEESGVVAAENSSVDTPPKSMIAKLPKRIRDAEPSGRFGPPKVAEHEKSTVDRLARHGIHAKFRNISFERGVKNPDIEIDELIWEMKSPEGSSAKNTISEQFKRAGKQAPRLVLDLQRCGLPDHLAIEQATRRFHGQTKILEVLILDHDGELTRLSNPGRLGDEGGAQPTRT